MCSTSLVLFFFSPVCLFSVVSFVLVPKITLARLPVIHRIDHFSEVVCMKMKKCENEIEYECIAKICLQFGVVSIYICY